MPALQTKEPVASAAVLDETPGRALTFLRGIANNPIIHALLAQAGFDGDDYQQGWALLHEAAGYTPTSAAEPEKSPAVQAMQELDAWDEDGFRRVRAALDRLHPEQSAFVFAGGLAASIGPGAVLGVKTLLDRLDELEGGEGRKGTHKADQAALVTLNKRGVTKAERRRLRALVVAAQTLEEPAPLPSAAPAKEQQEALHMLYLWFKDWSETARSVVKKRSHLITLGLAKRRSGQKASEPDTVSDTDKSPKAPKAASNGKPAEPSLPA